MNIRQIVSGFAALVLTISSVALADDIYKWTDADGNVHYEDRPSGDPSEQRLQFSYNRTNASEVQNRVQSQRDVATTVGRYVVRKQRESAPRNGRAAV